MSLGREENRGLSDPLKRNHKKSVVREYAEAFAIAILLALFIRTFVVQAFKIPSGSMIPTLEIGDHILVCKFLYGIKIPVVNHWLVRFSDPKRGDIIVFREPKNRDKDYIKRVIGLPGDRIEIQKQKVIINGEVFSDPYGNYIEGAFRHPIKKFGPVVVPEKSLFVLGDNRDRSSDSRAWGFVPYSLVKGKAFIIYYSKDGVFYNVRWGRIGKVLH